MDLFQITRECFVLKHLVHQRANFQYLSAVPDGGGVDVAIPKEIQGFATWE